MSENRIDPTAAPKPRKKPLKAKNKNKKFIIAGGAAAVAAMAAAIPFVTGPALIALTIMPAALTAFLTHLGWEDEEEE